MSKKKRLRAIKLTPAMLKEEQERVPSVEEVTEAYNNAAHLSLDTILVQDVPAGRAAMMIATAAFSIVSGRQSFYQFEIVQSTHILIDLWTMGTFTPPEHYPYTLEQTIAALQMGKPTDVPGTPDHTDVEVEVPAESNIPENLLVYS